MDTRRCKRPKSERLNKKETCFRPSLNIFSKCIWRLHQTRQTDYERRVSNEHNGKNWWREIHIVGWQVPEVTTQPVGLLAGNGGPHFCPWTALFIACQEIELLGWNIVPWPPCNCNFALSCFHLLVTWEVTGFVITDIQESISWKEMRTVFTGGGTAYSSARTFAGWAGVSYFVEPVIRTRRHWCLPFCRLKDDFHSHLINTGADVRCNVKTWVKKGESVCVCFFNRFEKFVWSA